jgi:hypothetical protein
MLPVLALLGIALVGIAAVAGSRLVGPVAPSGGQSATAREEGQSSADPWVLQPGAADRIKAAGLPVLPNEGTGEHFHAHLDVYVDGKAVTVPAWIGFTDGSPGQPGGASPVHTHDASGIIHIEAETPGDRYTLAQILREWGVLTENGAIGAYAAEEWSVFVNGARQENGPDLAALHPQEEIVLVHGLTPTPVPAAYAFPADI